MDDFCKKVYLNNKNLELIMKTDKKKKMNKLVQSACAGALTLALSLVGVGTASAKAFEPNSALTEHQ